MPDPDPGEGEVRIRVEVSGLSPGDVKKRAGWQGAPMPFPRVIPHSDGAGTIDDVGRSVDPSRVGQRVWCYGAQSYRPFGTAAEYVIVPEALAVALPHGAGATEDRVLAEQAACLGIAGITGYRAVFADGSVQGLHVIVTDDPDAAAQIRAVAPAGVNRMVDLSAHIDLDATVIATGGVICSYYSAADRPEIPYWTLGFADTTLRLLGSDDFPAAVKADAAAELTGALVDGSLRSQIAERVPLEELARAHGLVERGAGGRVIVDIA